MDAATIATMQQFLPPLPINTISLDELKSRFLLNTVLIKCVKDVLQLLPQKSPLSPRDVLAGYLFAYHRFTEDEEMIEVARELMEALHTQDITLAALAHAVSKYEATYFKWKRRDSEQVLKSLTEMYWEFELAFALNAGGMSEAERAASLADKNTKQQSILQRMMTMDGCRYFFSYVPVIFDGNAIKKIHDTLKHAFWDAIEEDLKQMPPKLDAFLRLCSDLRDTVLSIVIGKRPIMERFDDIMDIDYMRMMSEKGMAGADFWWPRCDYLIELLCDLDSPVRSAEHQSWYIRLKDNPLENPWRKMISVLWYVMDKLMALDEWVSDFRSNAALSNV